MTPGAFLQLTLVNATSHDIAVGDGNAYQMAQWFPTNAGNLLVGASMSADYTLQFFDGGFDEDDSAFVTVVSLDGATPLSMQIEALSGQDSSHYLDFTANQLGTPLVVGYSIGNDWNNQTNPLTINWTNQQTKFPLGNAQNDTGFIVVADLSLIFGAESATYYNSVATGSLTPVQQQALYDGARRTAAVKPQTWMQDSFGLLGDKPLRNICIPGTHDAGMSFLGDSTSGADTCNTVTQTASIGGQLLMGARYFDIRPVISGGDYYTGHYSSTSGVAVGGNGQSINQVIDDINQFTSSNKELIILYLSNDTNTDLGFGSYAPFNISNWHDLLNRLTNINDVFILKDSSQVDLSTLPLNQFINQGKAAVVIILEPVAERNMDPATFAEEFPKIVPPGFYYHSNLFADQLGYLSIYNQYSDTDDWSTMVNDQLAKMHQQRPQPDSSYFLLSWTLTQTGGTAATCFISGSSILKLAQDATSRVYPLVKGSCDAKTFPNIILLDSFPSTQAVGLVNFINQMATQTPTK